MTDGVKKRRPRQTPRKGANNVPKILEEARRLVDEMTDGIVLAELPAVAVPPGEPAAAATTAVPESPAGQPPATAKRRTVRSQKAKQATAADSIKTSAAPAPPFASPPPSLPAAASPALSPEMLGIRILHRVPGRTRLRILRLLGNAAFAQTLAKRLARVPGVTDVQTSVVTGSALFFYNPQEFRQPTAQRELQAAWQDLFPPLQTEKLTAALIIPGRF
mgnify:CR=1 FL=1